MSDEGIFATTAEVLRKAGANVSATYADEPSTNDFIAQAESRINAVTRFNWSDVYTTLDADLRDILKEAASNLAAIYIINADTDAFGILAAAQTRMITLRDNYLFAIGLLKDKQVKVFVNGS